MTTLDDFINPGGKERPFTEVLALAKTKYAGDPNVQKALSIYVNGTGKLKTKAGSIDGIRPLSDYWRRVLSKSIDLRERGLVSHK